MKQVFCALLLLGLGSTAFANNTRYVCNLERAGKYTQADAEILLQFKDGKVAIKGTNTGTCVGDVKYLGSDSHYGSRFNLEGAYREINANCTKFDDIQWYSTGEGSVFIHPNSTVALDYVLGGGIWARYTCSIK
ncbi:hypothetical protein ACLVWU_00490 [Bdellovibrio sp. HCB290]|uniref:hypothetical protein n=1 Tax=Bdellovibrio sp. HCB290 TaxID=3394356 RepID=UPI0039B3F2AA